MTTEGAVLSKSINPQHEEPWWEEAHWQSALPRRVLRKLQNPDSSWQAWVDHLASRKKPPRLSELISGKQSPLSWSLVEPDNETQTLTELLHKINRNKNVERDAIEEQISPWLAESTDSLIDNRFAIQCVAWAWSLEAIAQFTSEATWWELFHFLVQTADQATQLDPNQAPLEASLLAGELPLALAYSFPELRCSEQLTTDAVGSLSKLLVDLLDGEGMVRATDIQLFRQLLGCWTRCRTVMRKRKQLLWSDEAEDQYRWLVPHALRFTRPDGGSAFTPDSLNATNRKLLEMAVKLADDTSVDAIADHVLPKRSGEEKLRADWPGYSSEWSTLAILRDRWSRKSRQLAVTYPTSEVHLELSQSTDLLLSGPWSFQVTVDDRIMKLDHDARWEEVAWESDEDIDYLELELDITPALRLQRSFLLAREDQFLLVADALLGDDPGRLQYESSLPLSNQVSVETDQEVRDLALLADKPIARILPLALPEWSCKPCGGSLEMDDRQLILRQSGERSLFAPLFFDLSPKRAKRPVTWRQLSIGEDRTNISSDLAVGYRVQIGRSQWLIYRSLTPAANRTLIGQNLMCEFHVSRLDETGEVEELIEVQ